ncbi:MAG: precorrin-6A/cobalt-precorrin-6A reductase [Pseudomonadota bacterium]
MSKILLLGGTEEARALSAALVARGANLTVSLAGRAEADYGAPTRTGGFGGEAGLAKTLASGGFTLLVDATHPFASTISPVAARVSKRLAVRYVRLERPPWRRQAGDRWINVSTLAAAAARLEPGSRAFLTVGAGGLAPFLHRVDVGFIVRAIAAPDLAGRADIAVIEGRGPFSLEAERALADRFSFDTLVTKNAGGAATAAKLLVARERRTVVLMVARPAHQPRPNARNVEGMLALLRRHIA